MSGYLGTKAVTLSTTTASVGGDSTVGGDLTVDTNTLYVDSTNNRVGVGTSSPAGKLTVGDTSDSFTDALITSSTTGISELRFADTTINAGFIGYDHSSDFMKFGINATERMRITTDKVQFNVDAKVDATNSHDLGSSGARWKDLYIHKVDLDGGGFIDNDYAYFKSASGSNTSLTLRKDSTAADAVDFLQCRRDDNSLRLVIEGDGDVKNVNNSYGATSDQKLKENITDAGSQWDDIKAVQVRKYSFIDDDLDAPNQLGVIAQELEASGMSGLVGEIADVDEDNNDLGTVTKTVKYSILYMKAVKALQEAMERIETLETEMTSVKARLDALEGN